MTLTDRREFLKRAGISVAGLYTLSGPLQGIFARHQEKEENFGPGRDLTRIVDQTVNPNATSTSDVSWR